jgi:hypothetical protein
LVTHFTGGVKTRLGGVDEELYEGILFAGEDSEFVQQDRYICSIAHGDDCEYMRAKFLEWHIDFLMRRMEKMDREREKLKT